MTKKPNLIGISGRIGSGKDTVGLIIQHLLQNQTDWKVKKFAGKLKDVASLLTGIPAEQFEDQKFKDSYMNSSWSYFKQITEFDGDEGEDAYTFIRMTYRLFLQKLGTEAIRNGLHPNTWVNALFADYYPVAEVYNLGRDSDSSIWKKGESVNKDIYPNWIITDLRFPNEYEAIQSKGGLCIRVERGTQTAYYSDLPPESSPLAHARRGKELHPSETSLNSYKFDYVLDNSSDIESLVKEVEKMLRHFKLL
jgi:hypothetical protein